jgi:DEAD/DEAH box helicase domain-containing protein
MNEINYRQRMERVREYLHQGDYQVVIRECGTLLETALRASYAKLLSLTTPEKMERVRKAEREICREGQTYQDLGLGTMIALICEAKVFDRLNNKVKDKDYSQASHFDYNDIVNVDLRNKATHHGLIPSEQKAGLAYFSLLDFLAAAHHLELPRAEQAQREERFHFTLLRYWSRGYLTPAEQELINALAAELELSAEVVARISQRVQEDSQTAILAYEANRTPPFEAPPLRAYVSEQHNLPSILSSQVQSGLKAYLNTTFPINSAYFDGLLERFLDTQGKVIKGPYLSVKLPFQVGESGIDHFPEIQTKFTPYKHQEQAYQRLTAPKPKPTLVATGTGSGKTECFLYPILHHCYTQRNEPGIKAILIYPMNALATDQARRIAELIWKNPALKGKVNAGLYVGDRSAQPAGEMRADSVITNRDKIRDAPPDILLTNYKMLDFMLTRPQDFKLWKDNQPETLQFLVVDEIHTFDGAQGTDLACLLRRLRSRLKMPEGHLCPVGTSATLGKENRGAILKYASQIFGEPFEPESLILEQRQSIVDFLGLDGIMPDSLIPEDWSEIMVPENHPDYKSYIQAQYKLWFKEPLSEIPGKFNWRVELGKKLKTHRFFVNFIKKLSNGNLTRETLISELAPLHPELKHASSEYTHRLLDSLMALISSARTISENQEESQDPFLLPFLQVRAQIWVRELRRLVASVHPDQSELSFSDDQVSEKHAQLPVIHCRDCHNLGWAAIRNSHRQEYKSKLQDIYGHYLERKTDLWLLYPDADLFKDSRLGNISHQVICTSCLAHASEAKHITHGAYCLGAETKTITAMPIFTEENTHSTDCPLCGGQNNLSIIGHRSTTLTSVMISQIFASHYSDDKKIIAFSDSVQDASYRAGFFTARTYAFTLRSALQKYLDQAPPEQALTDIQAGFTAYWLERTSRINYVTQFLPADMIWIKEYEVMVESGLLSENSKLIQSVDQRLNWEIYRELTFRSRTGRTLEKAGLAMVALPIHKLNPVIQDLELLIANDFPQLKGHIKPQELRHFIALLIRHLKEVGAVYHEDIATVFRDHLTFGLYASFKNNPLWVPRKPGFTGPRPLTLDRSKVEAVFLQGNRSTWYQWLAESLLFSGERVFQIQDLRSLMQVILEALTRHGLLKSFPKDRHMGWALSPEQLHLFTDLTHLRCLDCSHQITVPTIEANEWLGQSCSKRPCLEGRYQLQELVEDDYYTQYYRKAAPERIFASEHTGLLSRPDREAVEKAFMASKSARAEHPWFTNLLSSTPTLEMGIDIGDLSTVLLCSVPPSQSSYIQRIGRSGRSDGNSLNITVAAGRPHDLYYFSDPLEMIEGEVSTPGVFLGAAAVLERQLMAYCFDTWVESGINKRAIDDTFASVYGTLRQKESNLSRFPYNLLAFITSQLTPIYEGFMTLFRDEMPPEMRDEIADHLLNFLKGHEEGSLSHKILERLTQIAQECSNYERDIKLLNKRIQRKEEDPALDPEGQVELDLMEQEMAGLKSILKLIKNKNLYNLLTDEGLLPNYAFPEEGITLRSVIFRKNLPTESADSKGKYETFEYEYQRPAASALMELAPNNYFYAGGKRVQINQVELRFGDVQEGANVSSPDFELWRFCDACPHMELETESTLKTACPQCQSEGWADIGQVLKLIRMRQVFSNTNIQDSLSGDKSEERDIKFFEKQLLVHFNPQDIEVAYQIRDQEYPFGFEYIRKIKLRDINFGESNTEFGRTGQKINRHEMSGQGFVLCRSCGVVQNKQILKPNSRIEAKHAFTCRRRKEETKNSELFSTSYLYREFQSEALRIFLPEEVRFEKEVYQQSFIAAIHLGLKAYFSGNIDHLAATLHQEPLEDSNQVKNYLILYDTVPGGTGYLKQLSKLSENKLVFVQILEAALEILKVCACQQEPDIDGCYHCIFTYKQIRHIESLSRTAAIGLLSSILQYKDHFVETDNINGIRPNHLHESELERRFIEALRRKRVGSTADLPVIQLTPEVVNGKLGYVLQMGEFSYSIEPQAELGPEQGVPIFSRTDFLIRPLNNTQTLPIAIFTDGFRFHYNRIGKDMAQRMSLVQSGKYHIWSLSWNDIDTELNPKQREPYAWNPIPKSLNRTQAFQMVQSQNKISEHFVSSIPHLHQASSFQHLLYYLANPEQIDWQWYDNTLLLNGVANPVISQQESDKSHSGFKESLMNISIEDFDSHYSQASGIQYFPEILVPSAELANPQDYLSSLIRFPQNLLIASNQEQRLQWLCLDDHKVSEPGFQVAWNGFLRLYNLFQFLEDSWFVTHMGLEQDLYQPILDQIKQKNTKIDLDEDWKKLGDELLNAEHLEILKTMSHAGWPLPVLGYEPCAENGSVLGVIEIAFPEQKLGLYMPEEKERLKELQSFGWKLIELNEALVASPETLTDNYSDIFGAK